MTTKRALMEFLKTFWRRGVVEGRFDILSLPSYPPPRGPRRTADSAEEDDARSVVESGCAAVAVLALMLTAGALLAGVVFRALFEPDVQEPPVTGR